MKIPPGTNIIRRFKICKLRKRNKYPKYKKCSQKFKYFKFIIILVNIILILIIHILQKNFLNEDIIMKDFLPVNVDKLYDFPTDKTDPILKNEKKELLKYISMCAKREIKKIKTIFLNLTLNFGNQLILLNKVIFFCEILGCKRIILNKKAYWFIKNKIIDKKYKMSIEVGEEKNYRSKGILIDNTQNLFFYFKYLRPIFRPEVIKNEILKNLPNVCVNPNDLYIYIRSGDIFEYYHRYYFQPPLCFYQNILNNFTFNNIYIISEKRNNPVIDKLFLQFQKVSYKINIMKYDIAYIINAYNLVGAYSTFLNYIIKYNDNLKYFWYFNFDTSIDYSIFFGFKFYHNVTKYRMNESDYYNIMRNCSNLEEQKQIMLKYKCQNQIIEIS